MNKHLSREENLLPEIWNTLMEYIIREYEILTEIGNEVYETEISPKTLEIKQYIQMINIHNFKKK
jgi:hypothetical protein